MRRNRALKAVAVDDDRGWEPRVLPGGFYCSPRCGGHRMGVCRKADFDKATKQATTLAASLGDGWKARVWENLGWYWEVAKINAADDTGMIVRHEGDAGYRAEFRSVAINQRSTQFFASGGTAEEAIGNVRQDVRTFIRRLENNLADSI